MATPFAAKGTLIKKSTTAIVDVENFDWSGMEMGDAETTNLDDTWESYVTTIIKPGELAFDILYDPADTTHQAFLTDLTDGSIDAYSINFSNAGADVLSGTAFAKSFQVTGSTKDKVRARCVLKFSGALTLPS